MLLGTAWPSDHGVGRWGWRYHGSTTEATGAAGARLTATKSMTRLVYNLVLTMTSSLVRRICHRARLGRPGDDSIAFPCLPAGISLLTTWSGDLVGSSRSRRVWLSRQLRGWISWTCLNLSCFPGLLERPRSLAHLALWLARAVHVEI